MEYRKFFWQDGIHVTYLQRWIDQEELAKGHTGTRQEYSHVLAEKSIFLSSDKKGDVQQGLIRSWLKLSEFFDYLGTCTVLDVPPGSTEVRVSEEVEDWNFLG